VDRTEEVSMISRTMGWLAATAAVLALGACAGHGQNMHRMDGAGYGPGGMGGGACPMHAEMHQKMADAKTPEERQALMAEHHKNMGMGGMGGMQCPMMQSPAK
jgi:hypothetical protein